MSPIMCDVGNGQNGVQSGKRVRQSGDWRDLGERERERKAEQGRDEKPPADIHHAEGGTQQGWLVGSGVSTQILCVCVCVCVCVGEKVAPGFD